MSHTINLLLFFIYLLLYNHLYYYFKYNFLSKQNFRNLVTLFGSRDSYKHNVKTCIKEMKIGIRKFSEVFAIPHFGLV